MCRNVRNPNNFDKLGYKLKSAIIIKNLRTLGQETDWKK